MTLRGIKSPDGSDRVVTNSDALSASQTTVAATATLIVAANPDRKGLVITNTSADATVYLGPDDVATTTGHALTQGDTIYLLPAVTTAAVYGIVAADTEVVTALEF